MSERILFVDDDENLLASFQRQLRNKFPMSTATGGDQGLKLIGSEGPFAVIVSDFRMPGMDGVQFLSKARGAAPDTVRMLLTGYADLQTAIEAVNQGNIFRLLTKPCPPDTLAGTLGDAVKQYRLVTAERELLEKTLKGSIQVLGNVLSMLNPEAFGRTGRISRYVREIAAKIGETDMWQLETAAALSQIGWVILPGDTLKKVYQGVKLTIHEEELFHSHPSVASDWIGKIPRMERIAEIVAFQEKNFDGSGFPNIAKRGEEIPLGARILKVALDFDALEIAGQTKGKALEELKRRTGCYDSRVLESLEAVIKAEARYLLKSVRVMDMTDSMILAEDVKTVKGLLLVTKGQELTKPLLERLRRFVHLPGIQEPIQVVVPLQ
jgi:response regulator RpfG family c-di-GMP phosphodiesterase